MDSETACFFVATAPISSTGHINCSPKGGDSFRVIDPLTVAYQDLTDSGVETIAHVQENSRIVLMFCAFDGPPKIVRIHGIGEILSKNELEYNSIKKLFRANVGERSIIKIKVSRISDSCGYSVPLMQYVEDRDQLDKWALTKGNTGLIEYRKIKNDKSIDGLPGYIQS